MRTAFIQKSREVDRKWFVDDAADKTLDVYLQKLQHFCVENINNIYVTVEIT